MVEGDDLTAIGERFDMSVDALKARNKLSSDTIKVGEKLAVLPVGATSATAQAEVSKETIKALGAPDRIETSIGTLEFNDGAPSAETA